MKPDQILASLSQLDHQKRPVTRVAIVFFTLACLSLGGMQAWSVYRARAVQLNQTQMATANLTQTVAEHTANTLTQAFEHERLHINVTILQQLDRHCDHF